MVPFGGVDPRYTWRAEGAAQLVPSSTSVLRAALRRTPAVSCLHRERPSQIIHEDCGATGRRPRTTANGRPTAAAQWRPNSSLRATVEGPAGDAIDALKARSVLVGVRSRRPAATRSRRPIGSASVCFSRGVAKRCRLHPCRRRAPPRTACEMSFRDPVDQFQRLIVAWPYSCPGPKLHGTPSKPQGGVAEMSRSVWGRPSCAVRCGEHYGRDALKVAEVKQVGVAGGEGGCRPAGRFGGDAVGHAHRAVLAVIAASS